MGVSEPDAKDKKRFNLFTMRLRSSLQKKSPDAPSILPAYVRANPSFFFSSSSIDLYSSTLSRMIRQFLSPNSNRDLHKKFGFLRPFTPSPKLEGKLIT